MKSFTVEVPLFITIGIKSKRKYFLNLNVYRNLPFQTNNKLKIAFKALVLPMLKDVKFKKYTITYTVFLPNKMKRDINNVCAVVDKFFADALVEGGVAIDDNYEFLPQVTYRFGGIAKNDGRVLIKVTELTDNEYQEIIDNALKDLNITTKD